MIDKIKKLPLFWKIYWIVIAVVMTGFIVLWVWMWSSLTTYENTRPEHAIKNFIKQIESEKTDSLLEYTKTSDTPYESEDEKNEAVKAYLKEYFSNAEWTYTKKSGDYTDARPAYQLKKDGEKTGIVVFFEKDPEKKNKQWKIESIDGLECMGTDYEITVPKDSVVTIDGTTLGSEYITKTEEAQGLTNVSKYINAPQATTYTINSVYKDHDIKAKGPLYGSELTLISNEDGKMDFGFEVNNGIVTDNESRIKDITKAYGNYIVNYGKFSDLSPYVLSGTYAYSYLSKISTTNIWFSINQEPEYFDMKVFNYQSYTKDCFSCEVSFNEKVTYDNDNTIEYPTHIQYIFVKRSDKWYVADLTIMK